MILALFAAGSGGTLTWYNNAGLTSVIGTGNSLTPSNTIGTSIYYVTEILSGCESPANTVTITINAMPVINSENSTDVTACGVTDGSIDIVASGGTGSYSFSIDGGATFTNTTGSFTGLDVNSYQVVVDDGNCQVTGSLLLISGPGIPPAPTAGTNATYCDGDAILDLTANADASGDNNNLTWYDDAGLTNIIQNGGGTFSPLNSVGSNTYYITETVAGCQSPSTQLTININPTPSAPILTGSNTYCDGDPISDLQASSGGINSGIFYWFDDVTLNNNVATGPVFTPPSTIGTQTYYVVDSLNGCVGATSSISITINPNPSYSISTTNPTTCLGTDGEIIISGLNINTSYDIDITDDGVSTGNINYNSDINGNIIISGLNAGTYSSIIITLNNCATIDAGPYVLTDPSAPIFSISSSDPTTCFGADGQLLITGLNANTNYDIDITDDGIATGAVNYLSDLNGAIGINGLDAGSYNSISVTINNCTSIDGGTYILSDPPTPSFNVSSTNPTICAGIDGQLLISGLDPNTTYEIDYQDDGTATGNVNYNSDVNGDIIISGLNAGVYSSINITLNGCSTLDPGIFSLVDPNAPTPSIINTLDPSGCGTMDAEILIGGLNANTTYTLDYNFNGNPVTTSTILTTVNGEYLLSGLDEGVYDAISIVLNSCVGNDAGVYNLFPIVPTILQPSGDSTYCEGQIMNDLTVVPNFSGSVNWYDDASLNNIVGNGNSFTVNALVPGTYSYYVTETLNGCESADTIVTVTIVAQPYVITSADTSICNGDTLIIQIDSISGGSQLSWSNGDTTLTTTVNPTTSTNYIVIVDDGLGCSATDTTVVTVNQNDDASFILSDYCAGNVNNATNIVSSGGDFFFNPPVNDGAIIDSITGGISNGVGGTTYTIMYLTSGVCPDSSIQNITVNDVPSAPVLSADTAYCEGENIIDLIANGGAGTIEWYDNISLSSILGTGSTFTPSYNIGEYTYYVNETLGNCSSEIDSIKISIFANPIADFSANPTSGVVPLNVDFTDNSSGNNLIYNWDFNGLSNSNLQNPTYTFSNIGDYIVSLLITDQNECQDQTSITISTNGVSIFVVPNIFTPNGDGINDELIINYENITGFEGYIVNRWGEVIYNWPSIDSGWNGWSKAGVQAPTGTYYYVVKATGTDDIEYSFQGHVRLVR